MVTNKATEGTRMLCKTKLNAVNVFRGINEFALSTLNYYVGLLPFKPKEYETIDKEVRKILSESKVTRNAANMDRLYLKRDQLGRGLACVEEKAELMLFKMLKSFEKHPQTRPLMEHEKEEKTQLGRICEYPEGKVPT
ncbi:hypothetical protein HPB47_006067 [Ixodes persulcatus]|uniref:Uncharacterized protein n=1 Tax=Ixodes persulcatus TaxID=34615 RepID=A0AC60PBA1_IXOPE|nr:hypothetical protein HPB47_006067 [Ixodes persulcatus]